jgi:formylglycine-generating enzyme required for sulfatase activity
VGYYDGRQIPAGPDMANGYGLYDMGGNVWEWCNDRYDWLYYGYSPEDNPTGPEEGNYRVLRGGGWTFRADDCRVGLRFNDGYNPGSRYYIYGFRTCATAGQL